MKTSLIVKHVAAVLLLTTVASPMARANTGGTTKLFNSIIHIPREAVEDTVRSYIEYDESHRVFVFQDEDCGSSGEARYTVIAVRPMTHISHQEELKEEFFPNCLSSSVSIFSIKDLESKNFRPQLSDHCESALEVQASGTEVHVIQWKKSLLGDPVPTWDRLERRYPGDKKTYRPAGRGRWPSSVTQNN